MQNPAIFELKKQTNTFGILSISHNKSQKLNILNF